MMRTGVGARAPLERSKHSRGVGVAAFPDDGGDIASLLEVADQRLLAVQRRLYPDPSVVLPEPTT
jgi:hypothetical protein